MSEKKLDLLTFGESMVSMTPQELGYFRYAESFSPKLAGAESNVAIGVTRLGHTAAIATAVGDDALGELVVSEIRREGVDTSLILRDPAHRTGVLFKERVSARETNVFYYRENSAASHMTDDLISDEILASARVLHLTGITPALGETTRAATLRLAQRARAFGVFVSFDPNLRLKLWTKEMARDFLLSMLPYTDLFLPGSDECGLLFGEGTVDDYIGRIREAGIRLCAVKLGRHGCVVMDGESVLTLPEYPFYDVVETVGAGDAFAAGFLSGWLEGKDIAECGAMANCMGAMATKSASDYQSLPDRRMLDVLLHKAPKPVER